MPLGLLCSMASRPLSRSRRCRPVVMHPRVWDHEVPLVMSQVIQATDGGFCTLGSWLHLMFTFTYCGEPLFCSAFHGDFRLFATWRSDSALGSESSKNARQWHFIRAEGSSNGSDVRGAGSTSDEKSTPISYEIMDFAEFHDSARALEPTCWFCRAGCSESASGIWFIISPFGIGYWYCGTCMMGSEALVLERHSQRCTSSSSSSLRSTSSHHGRGPDQPSSSSLARRVRVQPLLLSLFLFVR